MVGDRPKGLLCIHAPNGLMDRLAFFESLISFVNSWGCTGFVIFEDFNSVLHGVEH